MKLFFKTRSTARTFATKTGRKPTDGGTDAPEGRRWGVDVTPKAKQVSATPLPIAA